MKTTFKMQHRGRSSFSLLSMLFLMLLTAFTLSACGDDGGEPSQGNNKNTGSNSDKNNSNKANDGETKCGSETCGPGNYCATQTLSVCEPGCTSDLNCISTTHQCEVSNDVSAVGVCVRLAETDKTDPGKTDPGKTDPGKTDPKPDSELMKGCLAYCARANECEVLNAAKLAECNEICRTEATDSESRMLGECLEATNSCVQFIDECTPGEEDDDDDEDDFDF